MISHRRTAVMVGTLFIVATVATMVSMVLVESLLESPDDSGFFVGISSDQDKIVAGALFLLVNTIAVVLIPVLLFPILKKHDESLALGYLAFRILEAVALVTIVVGWLLLISLSKDYVAAEAPNFANYHASGAVLQEAGTWSNYLVSIFLSIGGLIFYYLLFASRLVPRFLSVWGLVGDVLLLAGTVLFMFGSIAEDSAAGVLSVLVLASNEIVLAVWLIVKGFNPSAVEPPSAGTNIAAAR
jgi:hypothetical protein